MDSGKSKNLWYYILANVFILLIFIFLLEMGARVFLYFSRGSSTVGLPERTQYLSYQPFVMFGPDWESLLDPMQHPTIKNNVHVHRVLLLGGSTAALFPKKILEAAFRKKFPHHEFEVINAAEGGYNARQEVIVASLWGAHLAPEIIISLDGANDLTHRIRMKNTGKFYLDSAYNLALKQPFLSPFAHILRHSQLVQGLQRSGERLMIGTADQYADAVPIYISAEHSINILAKGLSATRIMVLQPFMSFKAPLSKEEAQFTAYQYRESVIKTLYNVENENLKKLATQDKVIYLDGRFLFKGINKTLFSDDVHFVDDQGYRILAENIVNQLTKNSFKK